MFKIITKKKYKALLKEIKELKEYKEPEGIIIIEAKEHIDILSPWLDLEKGRIKRNISIALRKQIEDDESLIEYYRGSDKPDIIFARIRIVRPKNFSDES